MDIAASAVVVISAAEPVHRGHVDGVTPHVFERAVVAAVAADLGVAVNSPRRICSSLPSIFAR